MERLRTQALCRRMQLATAAPEAPQGVLLRQANVAPGHYLHLASGRALPLTTTIGTALLAMPTVNGQRATSTRQRQLEN